MSHTQTPWIVEPGPDEDIWILSDDDDANEGSIIASVQGPDGEKNASHIVRCVNSHDALVEAVNNALSELYCDRKDLAIKTLQEIQKQTKGE